MEENNKSSNRRSFVRKLLGLGAAAGATSLLLAGDKSLVPLAQAGSGTGATVNIDEVNYGVDETVLKSITSDTTAFTGWATSGSGAVYGLYGRSDSTEGTGVFGWASASTGISYGVYGWSDSVSSRGVFGYAGASTGTTEGVHGESNSTSGRGVYGYVSKASGTTIGVFGNSDSTSGTGLYGRAAASTGSTYGVYGDSYSTEGMGVYGIAYASSGTTYGVFGQSNSINGYGVRGYTTNASGYTYGVHGRSESVLGTGVYGYASASGGSGSGVYGRSDALQGVGVYAYAGNTGAKPIVARGASGQTANLQEWQNNAGTALSVIDKNGKLGIGTSSPSFMLHIISGVTGPLTAASAPGAGPAPNSFICENLTSGNAKSQFTFRASGVNKYSFGNDIAGTGGQNFFIWDEVAAEAVMYIDSGRKVGLGTLSPTEKLHVVGNVKAASFITGDIVMTNDYKVTEDERDGVAFLNPKGEKIAVLDREGNWHIKGRVMEDL